MWEEDVYRKIPELDGYTDAQCYRIIEAVTTRSARLRRTIAIFATMAGMAMFVALPLCFVAAYVIILIYDKVFYSVPVWVPMLVFLAVLAAAFAGVVKSGRILGRSLLRAQIVKAMRACRVCRECEFVLAGLKPGPGGFFACPECGTQTKLAPTWEELLGTPPVENGAAGSKPLATAPSTTRGATL